MPILLCILAVQVVLIAHVMKTSRDQRWLMALAFVPVAGSVAYLIFEILPRFGTHRHVRQAKAQIVSKIDPERELRAARAALDLTDTAANRLRVADALTELERHAEALPLYRAAAGPPYDFRTGEKLAASLFFNDQPDEALRVIDALPKVIGQSDLDRVSLLKARVLEELGRFDEAIELYAEIRNRMPGDEARCRYAALLLKVGRKGQAILVLEDVERRLKHVDRWQRAANGPMYDWAMSELTRLRA